MNHHYAKGRGAVFGLIGLLLVTLTGQLHADCTVSAGTVAFGSYSPFDQQAQDSAGTINVNCSPEASYVMSLSPGGGSYAQRQLSDSGELLYYNLYTNASRSVIWGDGSGGSSTVGGSGGDVSYTVYGRIPAQQNVEAGTYGDSIIVTVTF